MLLVNPITDPLTEKIKGASKYFYILKPVSYFTAWQSFIHAHILSLCPQHVICSFLWGSVVLWMCYRLWCLKWFHLLLNAGIETGLSASAELVFTLISALFHGLSSVFSAKKRELSLWTLTPTWSTSTHHQGAKHTPLQLTPALPSIYPTEKKGQSHLGSSKKKSEKQKYKKLFLRIR